MCFLFHLKSSFRSQDIQIFVFPSSPLFLPVSHCFRAWSKINLKVYDNINCLNKNLITHLVWYMEKEKKYDIETLAIDRALNKEHFYEKIMHKMCTKTHLVWYMQKKKRYDIETLAIDRVLNKEHFYGKIMQKICTKR